MGICERGKLVILKSHSGWNLRREEKIGVLEKQFWLGICEWKKKGVSGEAVLVGNLRN
jgi:hypothetical protein